jgi:hypothetical protein
MAMLLVLGGCYRTRHPVPRNADPRDRAAFTALLPFIETALWNESGRVQDIDLVGNDITGADVNRIAVFADLETLQLIAPFKVKDEDLACLQSLPRLTALDLMHTPIGDSGVEHISRIETLKSLRLSHTRITDKSLEYLARLKNLETLYIEGTRLTHAAVERFRQRRPNCKVHEEEGADKTDKARGNGLGAPSADSRQ